jgi:hypothetical protein
MTEAHVFIGEHRFSFGPADDAPPPAIGVAPALEAAADEIKRRAAVVASTLHVRTTLPKLEAAQAELLAISSRALGLYGAVADELERIKP